jgi:hypothetical protein
MFIVTQGADNVKLGDVEILLIEKSQITHFLQNKRASIGAEIQQKRQEVAKVQQKADEASKSAAQAQMHFDSFMASKLYKTNADYTKASLQWNVLYRQYIYQTNYVQRVYAYSTNHFFDEQTENTFLAAVKKREEMAEKLNSLNDQMKTAKIAATEAESEKLNSAKSNLEKAYADLAIAQTNLNSVPTVGDYLGDFSPIVIKKALSDADGKFVFTYSREKTLAILASAQRVLLNKKEKYFWLVDAPTNLDKAQIFLSNNNLVYVDPDGYFKIKPKQGVQELADVSSQ